MVSQTTITLEPEIHELYPPPPEFEDIWAPDQKKGGGIHDHQYSALTTDIKAGRIHAPTGTGKSRAAAFYAVAPFHRCISERIQATFAYPTNLLTKHQFKEGLVDGLIQNLGYEHIKKDAWHSGTMDEAVIPYQRLRMPGGEELRIAELTGTGIAKILLASSKCKGKADLLQDFLDWFGAGHNFLVCSPDLIAYAVHEQYGSSSFHYYAGVKRRVHSLLRGKTLVLDEYHQYDPFTLINIERLLSDENLGPDRTLLLSATQRREYFLGIPEIIVPSNLPEPIGSRTASREIEVNFNFNCAMPELQPPEIGLTLCIHNSVVQNRMRCARLRAQGVSIVQWDGTRKDEIDESIHLVLGTSAIEVGLDLDADTLLTEWSLRWMTPNQITQRIGRVGRREGGKPATAEIYSQDALEMEIRKIQAHNGKRMTKDELNDILHGVSGVPMLNRDSYVSQYYFGDGKEKLTRRRLLQPNENLRYSFRPPGTQALFLDRSEHEPSPFIYERAPIINRYETVPSTPDDRESLDQGWKQLCDALHINLEEDFLVIRGSREKRGWLDVPTGKLDDLKKPNMRRYYLDRGGNADGRSQFI